MGYSVYASVKELNELKGSTSWPEARCLVLAPPKVPYLQLKYNRVYRVDVPVRVSKSSEIIAPNVTAHRFGTDGFYSELVEATTFASRFVVDDAVPCWHKPDDPTRVILSVDEPSAPLSSVQIGMISNVIIMLMIIGLTIYIMGAAWAAYAQSYAALPPARQPSPMMLRAQKSFKTVQIQRSNSHYFHRGNYVGSHDAAIRNGFVTKVYGIVLAQVILTAAISLTMMLYEPLAEWAISNHCV